MTNKFFVYGTLRGGDVRSSCFPEGSIRHEDSYYIEGTLYSLGAFPALVRDGDTQVVGEVVEVPEESLAQALSTLDAIEGVAGGLYVREKVTVSTHDGHEQTCWVYTAGDWIEGEDNPVISSGDWFNRKKVVV